jgi:uncharacterized protein YwbE
LCAGISKSHHTGIEIRLKVDGRLNSYMFNASKSHHTGIEIRLKVGAVIVKDSL